MPDAKRLKQFQQPVQIFMFPRPKPKGCGFTSFMVYRPPQPDLMLFIVKKTPHFIHFYANHDIFMRFKIIFVHILCLLFFFFNSFMTVSVLAPSARAVAGIPDPSAARLIMAFFTSGLHPL
jgi:hypothetical protein